MIGNTPSFIIESPINAMAVSRGEGMHLAVAGRSLLKVYSLAPDNFGGELFNLRSSNLKNLNFSNNDVTWSPLVDGVLATGATNGGVVVWNLNNAAKSKIEHVFNAHQRTVNRVCFHSADPNCLLSGSQDGLMKLFDLRQREAVACATFVSNSESVRDVQFSPAAFSHTHFASVQETGNVELWDIRRSDRPETNFIAHDGPVFACEWHPNQEGHRWLATGGRDKTIKVWDMTNSNKPKVLYNLHTIAPVSKLKWRPGKDLHIGSCSLVMDFSVYVWDIMRPYVPYATFATRKDVSTGFAWRGEAETQEFISTCKDGSVYVHNFENDAYYPGEHYPPIGVDFNPAGDVVFSMTDFIHKYAQYLYSPNSAPINGGGGGSLLGTVLNNNSSSSSSSNNTSNELQAPMTSRLVKTPSLGANAIITPNGFISERSSSGGGVGGGTGGQNLSNPVQQYTLSSSLNQSNWDIPVSTSVEAIKSNRNIMSYLPSQFQYHQPQQSQQQQLALANFPLLGGSSSGSYPPTVYNISVPLSYRRSPEDILAEHFRCMISYMMFFLSRDATEGTAPGLQHNYDTMRHFVKLAKKYKLSDEPFEVLCEDNAAAADHLGLFQVANTWRLVRYMFSIIIRHPTSSGGGAGGGGGGGGGGVVHVIPGNNNPSGGSAATNNMASAVDMKREENSSRHTSGGAGAQRHYSGNAQNIPSGAGGGGAMGPNIASSAQAIGRAKDDYIRPLEYEDDELHSDIDSFYRGSADHRLKEHLVGGGSIPKSRFATDYFDVPPMASDGVDYYDGATQATQRGDGSGNLLYDPSQDYELKHESILHRHQLFYSDEYGNLTNPGGDFTTGGGGGGAGGGGGGHPNYDINSPVSFDEDDDAAAANEGGSSFGLFDVNLQSLLGAKNPATPAWIFTDIVANMLRHYVEIGDVQTAISIIQVLGSERLKQLTSIDRMTVNVWYRAYIDLLNRFQLWGVSCRLIKLSTETDIQAINQTGTTVLVYCAKCMKQIRPGSTCEKCSLEPTNCAICHVAVRGMFTWCQGCAHGGHLQHMRQWFKDNAQCPAGCGHHCELC